MASSRHEVFLVVYPGSGNVPAHWAMLVPIQSGAEHGTKIHAIGAPFIGYTVEIKSSYDLSKTRRRNVKISLGYVDETKLGSLEEVAQSVQAPGVSKTPLDPFGGERCQSWMHKYIKELVFNGLIDQDAVRVLDDAPRV
ncbi:hypothetical protein CC86DRAFT_120101 [Ophiobolus disseminans]|uniref:Uncharacterized protein n=1 Tax=Ophiobolus disseminans TaxID=1469910 RepID=A0A6A6ZHZ6_9PLEO|nr:hypothetical protein CC86DRAFT_120101 [Ophiobolus disseminans]